MLEETCIDDLEASHEVKEAMAGHPIAHFVTMFVADVDWLRFLLALGAVVVGSLHLAFQLVQDCQVFAWVVAAVQQNSRPLAAVAVVGALLVSDIAAVALY